MAAGVEAEGEVEVGVGLHVQRQSLSRKLRRAFQNTLAGALALTQQVAACAWRGSLQQHHR